MPNLLNLRVTSVVFELVISLDFLYNDLYISPEVITIMQGSN